MQPTVTFRDPPSVFERATALEASIAKILVRAPTLPVEIPAFGFTLSAIEVLPGAIALVLSRAGGLIARVQFDGVDGERLPTVAWRWAGLLRRDNDRRALDRICERLRASLDIARWADAHELAARHRDLPRHVAPSAFRMLVSGSRAAEGLVRTGFQCNQDCGLCWQGRTWGRNDPEQILAWIEDLRAAGAETLIISGGEPTLDSSLPRYIRRGRELGFGLVTIETNAIQMAKPGVAARLRDAGLQRAFVSLHSGDPSVSDRVTRAPGTHKRTVAGIAALLEQEVQVTLNAVVTSLTLDTLADLPAFVHSLFGESPFLEGIVVSDLGATFDDSALADLAPHPTRTREALRAMSANAKRLGVAIHGSDGPCGPPLCVWRSDEGLTPAPIPGPAEERVYVRACDACVLRASCYGVRKRQVELFGEGWIEPFVVSNG